MSPTVVNTAFLLAVVNTLFFPSPLDIETPWDLGTVFLLGIIAAAGLKPKIRAISMDMIMRLTHALRCPFQGNAVFFF
jgi:hypothetical protein